MLETVPVVADGPAADLGLSPSEAASGGKGHVCMTNDLVLARTDRLRQRELGEVDVDGVKQMLQASSAVLVLVEAVARLVRGTVEEDNLVVAALDVGDRPRALVLVKEEGLLHIRHGEGGDVPARGSEQGEVDVIAAVPVVQPGNLKGHRLDVAGSVSAASELGYCLVLDACKLLGLELGKDCQDLGICWACRDFFCLHRRTGTPWLCWLLVRS